MFCVQGCGFWCSKLRVLVLGDYGPGCRDSTLHFAPEESGLVFACPYGGNLAM